MLTGQYWTEVLHERAHFCGIRLTKHDPFAISADKYRRPGPFGYPAITRASIKSPNSLTFLTSKQQVVAIGQRYSGIKLHFMIPNLDQKIAVCLLRLRTFSQ